MSDIYTSQTNQRKGVVRLAILIGMLGISAYMTAKIIEGVRNEIDNVLML